MLYHVARFSGRADSVEDNDYDYDKYRVENDVENFPENAADWTGRKVGEVEAIPQDIEYGIDRFVSAVSDSFILYTWY